jgi:hypothetical protein
MLDGADVACAPLLSAPDLPRARKRLVAFVFCFLDPEKRFKFLCMLPF